MSIFKRLSKKKKGENPDAVDDLVLDESISLTKDDNADLPIPKSADDAFPSLGNFTQDEQEVILSILNNEPTKRETKKEETAADKAKLESEKRPAKSVNDILEDHSYKSAFSILKGDIGISLADENDAANLKLEIDEDEDKQFDDVELAPEETAETIADFEDQEIEFEDEVETEADQEADAEIESELESEFEIDTALEMNEEIEAEIDSQPSIETDFEVAAEADTILEQEILPVPEIESDPQPVELTAREPETAPTNTIEENEIDISGEAPMTSEFKPSEPSETETNTEARTEIRADYISGRPVPCPRRVDFGEMRTDLASIVSDFENGESMYRRAQQRVENLTTFIERAEVDFSLLDRLEPENRALKSENMTLISELDKRKGQISQLNSNLEDIQRRFGDAQSELDETHSKLAQSIKNFERAERDISELNTHIQETRLKYDRTRNELDVENRENSNLRARLTDLTEQLEKTTSEKLGYAKHIETLKIDLDDQSQNREKLRTETADLRHALEEAQRQNTRMRGEISSVHEDIRGFKTQYEFNILKRDERISDLESTIIELNDKLRIKEDIINSTARDVSVLRKERTTQDLERERLETSLQLQSLQLSETEDELLRSKLRASEIDQRYKDVTTALAHSAERRQSAEPSTYPDITPPANPGLFQTDDINLEARPMAPAAERITPKPQVDDEIENMLTDYKLGLRSNLR